MVVVYKDIFFANIPGIDHGECHLDLYLPNMLPGNGSVHDKEHNALNIIADDEIYDGIKAVKKTTNGSQGVHMPKKVDKTLYVKDTVKSAGDTVAFDDELTGNIGTRESYSGNNLSVPFVLFIHGGGWRRGGRTAWKHFIYFDVNFLVAFLQYFRRTYSNIGETLAENKIACAVISYPLTEAGPLVLLVEMLMSYLQCMLFVFFCCLPVIGLLSLIRTINTWEFVFNEHASASNAGIAKLVVTMAMLATNLATSLLFFIRRKQFDISINQIRLFSVVITMCCLVSRLASAPVIVLVSSTLVVNQVMLFIQRFSRYGARYEQQVNAVAQALKWAKRFCEDTGYTDATRLYLMGHSAGGHLATLLALDESALSSASCSSIDLKVIFMIVNKVSFNYHIL